MPGLGASREMCAAPPNMNSVMALTRIPYRIATRLCDSS